MRDGPEQRGVPVRGVAHAVGRLGGLLKQMRQRHAEQIPDGHVRPRGRPDGPSARMHAEGDHDAGLDGIPNLQRPVGLQLSVVAGSLGPVRAVQLDVRLGDSEQVPDGPL